MGHPEGRCIPAPIVDLKAGRRGHRRTAERLAREGRRERAGAEARWAPAGPELGSQEGSRGLGKGFLGGRLRRSALRSPPPEPAAGRVAGRALSRKEGARAPGPEGGGGPARRARGRFLASVPRLSLFSFHSRRPRSPPSKTTCEGGRDWRRRSCGRSRAAASSVQKKMGFGVNLGV